MFTFSDKPNGISMILEPCWSLFGRYGRTDGRTDERTEDRAAQPAPPSRRTILSPWTGSAPPLQYTFRAMWKVLTPYRIQNSIPIEQERSVLHFLGSFFSGPSRPRSPDGPGQKSAQNVTNGAFLVDRN